MIHERQVPQLMRLPLMNWVGGMAAAVLFISSAAPAQPSPSSTTKSYQPSKTKGPRAMDEKTTTTADATETTLPKTDKEWADRLTPEQYRILREKGTERAFTGPHLDNKKRGEYICAGCGTPLFASDSKFNSGTGWPSYSQPVAPNSVEEIKDVSHGMVRTEVVCAVCKGHLGHVFPDGPAPTGLRYCINGHSLKFEEKK